MSGMSEEAAPRTTLKIIVYHGSYGCETGCCGHRIELVGGGIEGRKSNDFDLCGHPHPGDELQYARDLVREKYGEEHVADLDWEHCRIENIDDCKLM